MRMSGNKFERARKQYSFVGTQIQFFLKILEERRKEIMMGVAVSGGASRGDCVEMEERENKRSWFGLGLKFSK